MSSPKQKLELTWIGKENRPKLEPRILLEDPRRSYHARHRVTDNDVFDNRLIFGDNLLALKAAKFNIYAYDAYYLQCCVETRMPLISLDDRMCDVAGILGIKVVR